MMVLIYMLSYGSFPVVLKSSGVYQDHQQMLIQKAQSQTRCICRFFIREKYPLQDGRCMPLPDAHSVSCLLHFKKRVSEIDFSVPHPSTLRSE